MSVNFFVLLYRENAHGINVEKESAMLNYCIEHIGELASIITIIGSIWLIISRSHKKLHQDMVEIRQDIKGANGRIDAMGSRIDAMGLRIDRVYEVLMAYIVKDKS